MFSCRPRSLLPLALPLASGLRFHQATRHQRLALLWQIYSPRRSLQIHFLQCGHRCGGSRAMSSRMAWRTAGKLG